MAQPPIKKKPYNNAAKYLNIGYQMIAMLIAGIIGGHYLDKLAQTSKPYFTLLLSVIALGISFYFLIRSLIKKEIEEEKILEENPNSNGN